MSREHNDGIDAMRYATDTWARSREALLRQPAFMVQRHIDYNNPYLAKLIENQMRAELMEGIAEVLCDGEYHVIKVTRQEEPLCWRQRQMEAVITYRAELTEVQHRHHLVADAWNEYNRYKKSTGRNHRKKDRAKARRLRAERKKLAERLKIYE